MLSVCHTTDLCQGEMLLMLVCNILILTLFRIMRIPINVRLPDDRCRCWANQRNRRDTGRVRKMCLQSLRMTLFDSADCAHRFL